MSELLVSPRAGEESAAGSVHTIGINNAHPRHDCVQFLRINAPKHPYLTANKIRQFIDGRYQKAKGSAHATWFDCLKPIYCPTAETFFAAIRQAANEPRIMMIHGYLRSGIDASGPVRRKSQPWTDRRKIRHNPAFEAGPVRYVMRDFDLDGEAVEWSRGQGLDLFRAPRDAIMAVIQRFAPELAGIKSLATFSASAGFDKQGNLDGAAIRFHLFHALSEPAMPSALRVDEQQRLAALADQGLCRLGDNGQLSGPRDPAVFNTVQPNFIAPPTFVGCTDPIPERWHYFNGAEAQDVCTLLKRPTLPSVRRASAGETKRQAKRREAENAAEIAKWEATNGESYHASRAASATRPRTWPRDWESCLALMGYDEHGAKTEERRGVSASLYWAARRFVEANHDALRSLSDRERNRHFDHVGARIAAAVDVAPNIRLAKSETEIDADRREALGKPAREWSRLGLDAIEPAHRGEGLLAPSAARAATAVAVAGHFDQARRFHDAMADWRQVLRRREIIGWKASRAAGDPMLNMVRPTVSVLAADRGCGKTYAVMDELARRRIAAEWRFLSFAPTVKLAQHNADEYAAALERHGHSDLPAPVVLEGFDRLCMVRPIIETNDESNPDLSVAREVASKIALVERHGYSPLDTICRAGHCPFAATCKYPKQFEDARKPGAYFAATSALTASAHPFATKRAWNPEEDQQSPNDCGSYRGDDVAPIFGAHIDEFAMPQQLRGLVDGAAASDYVLGLETLTPSRLDGKARTENERRATSAD